MIPKRTDLKTWAASLVIDFPTDNIPLLTDANNWKYWGSLLVEEQSFSDNGAPSPNRYNDWQKWAEDVFKTMASY